MNTITTLAAALVATFTAAPALAQDASFRSVAVSYADLDLGSEAGIVEFLRNLNCHHGVTVLVVTHLLPLVLNLATSIMLFARGTILHGGVDEVLQEQRLTSLYGVAVHLGAVAGRRTLVVTQPLTRS